MAGLGKVGSPTMGVHPVLSDNGALVEVADEVAGPVAKSSTSIAIPDHPLRQSSSPTNTNPDTTSDTAPLPLFPPNTLQSHGNADYDNAPEEPSALAIKSPNDVLQQQSRGHRKSAPSVEAVPRQTIMKALASVARSNKPEALSLNGMLSAHAAVDKRLPGSSQQASDALSDALLSELAARNMTPTTAFPSLQSPCFYHERFDDAVDINKVLEEIKNDEYMSHSRLVQTATGVREVSKQLQRRPIRRAVRSVMIVTKARDNELVYLTRELTMWLLRTPRYGSDIGVNVYVDAKLRNSKRFGASSIVDEDPRFENMLRYWSPDLCWSHPEKFDLVLTLGGDGTVLFTSWLFQRIVPPVLSFSLGSLGFLTTFEFERYKHYLNKIMGEEGMRVNLRMRFTCTVFRNGGQEMEEGEQFEVLNELVIDRGPSPYVSNLELHGDNELLTVVQADGCIFSTPTGSTAYSLSAGGSLVSPDLPAILLTPICPHTLSFRPMVLSDTMLLRVSIPRNSRATAYCAFDGKGRVELKQGDCVTITASQYPFPTVMRTETEWFDSVSRTLQWNTRAATQKGFESKSGSVNEDDEPEWDIDTDSACYASEDGSISASPLRRQMSLLGM
ncbi:ATP-NAD kinase [Hypomontagnella submonticulosa]|nr:ATP-NAD kinase [Hypomontagnella submonticulosa]